MKKLLLDKEMLTGVVFAAIAIIYLSVSALIPNTGAVSIGAEFMPRIYGIILLGVSLGQVFMTIGKWKKNQQQESADEGKKESIQSDPVNVIKVAVLIIAYVLVMNVLGFVISSVAFLFMLAILLTPAYAKKNYVKYAMFSIILPLAAYFLFKNYLNLILPAGILFQ